MDMNMVNMANSLAQYEATNTQGIMMLKKIQDQVKVQGQNMVEAIDASAIHIDVNDGKSLDVKI